METNENIEFYADGFNNKAKIVKMDYDPRDGKMMLTIKIIEGKDVE